MSITSEDIERFETRESANAFIRSLRFLDASTPRKPGAPSRIERLRDAVAKAMAGEGGGDHDDDGDELTREVVTSKAAHSTKFTFQRGNGGGPLVVESTDAELKALAGRVLYVKDARSGGFLPVAECE